MKPISLFTGLCLSMLLTNANAQTINWKSLDKNQKHIINLHAGLDFSLVAGAGYGYQLRSKLPIILHVEYAVPAGNRFRDDFKTKIGGQARIFQVDKFQFSARVQGLFRRYENDFARLLNFGSDMAAVAGFYKPRWFAAGEAGFDKAIVTHFKHRSAYKENFPSAQDGWFEPSTGGHFYYGLQAGYSTRQSDIYIKGGKMLAQDFYTRPLLPYYVQVGYNIRLK